MLGHVSQINTQGIYIFMYVDKEIPECICETLQTLNVTKHSRCKCYLHIIFLHL